MTIPEIYSLLKERFSETELELEEIIAAPVIRVQTDALVDISIFLRDNETLLFDSLMCLSGLETTEELQTIYHLYSNKHAHKVILRCGGSKEEEVIIPTVCEIWPTAEWHEREAYDLFGIHYADHPDLRRILNPDDWEGHPLCKDYIPQEVWHGIPLTATSPEQRNNGGKP